MPKWATYKVLAYKVSTERMVDVAARSYTCTGKLGKLEDFTRGLEAKDDKERTKWIHRGVRDALTYLIENTKIPFRFYTQQFLKNRSEGFLLAFASSHKLPPCDDRGGRFFIEYVRPDDRISDIRHFASLIGYGKEEPGWYIPDDAHNLDVLTKKR